MLFAASAVALAACLTVASAGTVTFWTLDDATRTIHFTSNPGSTDLPSVTVNNKEKTVVTFPDGWVGNYYAVQDGKDNKPGMLGEVNFSHDGKTYFDVSAIVDPSDHDNVKQMWPKSSQSPMSGCVVFPCNNVYTLPDDVQTKVTDESDLITTLGAGSTGIKFSEE